MFFQKSMNLYFQLGISDINLSIFYHFGEFICIRYTLHKLHNK